MLQGPVIVLVAFAYLGVLFGIAYYADQRADAGRSVIANPYIYALSLAVYATAWTFYGSVGRAASDGIGFLPIYLGPTLMIALWWLVMRKIIRISKSNRITTLADFVASRYGKSALIGGLVTVIAVIGILPYISLQLKAIAASYAILLQYPEISMPPTAGGAPLGADTAFWIALILAAFTILFGTRHLDAAEHHEGMVAAIAFESLMKLVAFLAVGLFVTYGMYNGIGDIFQRAWQEPNLLPLMTPLEGVAGGYGTWVWLTILKALTEVAGMALIGQGILFLFAGANYRKNIPYAILAAVTRPVFVVARFLSPRFVPDGFIWAVAPALVLIVWILLTYFKIKLILRGVG